MSKSLEEILNFNVLSSKGYKRIYQPEFLDAYTQIVQYLFGEDFNLDFDSDLGKFIQMLSLMAAEANERGEKTYLSAFVDFAEGEQLDIAVKRYGMVRIIERYATATAAQKFTITPGGTVPAGTIVATESGLQYVTGAAVVDLDNDGIVYTDVTAVDPGPIYNVPAGEITELVTPGSGITDTVNMFPLTSGRSRETDQDLRRRYYASQSRGGMNSLAAIRSALLSLEDVRAALVFQNNADVASPEGYPPHSVIPVLLGGVPEVIGNSLMENVAAGIQTFGNQSVMVKDDSGKLQPMFFSYASQVDIYVEVTITRSAAFPQNGENLVKEDVVKYIGGTLNNTDYQGLGMAVDVIQNLVLRSIQVAGIADIEVKLRRGDTGEYVSGNIDIGTTETAQTSVDKVAVSFVN